MPIKEFSFSFFHGGLNNDSDIRDILDEEALSIRNGQINKIGVLRATGATTNDSGTDIDPTCDIYSPGKGLFFFSMDRDLSGNFAPTNYVAIAGENSIGDYIVEIFEEDATKYGTEIKINENDIDTGDFYPKIIFFNGIFIATDGNFLNVNSTTKFVAFVKDKKHFESGALVYVDMVSDSFDVFNILQAPSINNAYENNAFAVDDTVIPYVDTGGIGLALVPITGGNISFTNDMYIYIAYIYEDDSISSLTYNSYIDASSYTAGSYKLRVKFSFKGTIYPTNTKGLKIFYRIGDTDNYYELFDLIYASELEGVSNVNYGLRESGSETIIPIIYNTFTGHLLTSTNDYSAVKAGGYIAAHPDINLDAYSAVEWIWEDPVGTYNLLIKAINPNWVSTDSVYYSEDINSLAGVQIAGETYGSPAVVNDFTTTGIGVSALTEITDLPIVKTYRSITGVVPQVDLDSGISFNEAIIANQRVYAGNVRFNGENFPDSIFKSAINNPFLYSKEDRLDVVIQDGESLTKLEYFADRILQFKERHLYIINISQAIEFVESRHDFMGVSKPYHVTRTEFGIAWANERGIFLYDGQKIIDLFKRKGIRKISIANWATIYSTDIQLGYIPIDKMLVVLQNNATESSGSIGLLSFDFNTMGWMSQIETAGKGGGIMTNFATNWNNELAFFRNEGTQQHKIWDRTLVSNTAFEYITKDFVGSGADIKKNLLSLVVVYKGGTSQNLVISYALDKATSFINFDADNNSTQDALDNTSTTAEVREEFKRANDSAILEDWYSIRFKFSGTIASTFELYDVILKFREKGTH